MLVGRASSTAATEGAADGSPMRPSASSTATFTSSSTSRSASTSALTLRGSASSPRARATARRTPARGSFDLADQRHYRAPIAQARERQHHLFAHLRHAVVEPSEQRQDGVGAPRSSERAPPPRVPRDRRQPACARAAPYRAPSGDLASASAAAMRRRGSVSASQETTRSERSRTPVDNPTSTARKRTSGSESSRAARDSLRAQAQVSRAAQRLGASRADRSI